MKSLKLELNLEELKLLTSLASDQLFRREFIDPKLPGHKADPANVHMGKAVVSRMQAMLAKIRTEGGSPAPATRAEPASSSSSKRTNGKTSVV